MSTWQEWLAEQRAQGTMSVKVISLNDVVGWGMQEQGKHFGRPDGKFFREIGIEITNASREVTTWSQPLLQETGGTGVVALFKARGEDRFLVAARAEPGNPQIGCILLGPPLQASRANLEQAHGGKRPPRAELLDEREIRWVRLTMDGGRNYRKVNECAVVVIDESQITLQGNERWFTRAEMCEALFDGEVNQYLALLLALLLVAA